MRLLPTIVLVLATSTSAFGQSQLLGAEYLGSTGQWMNCFSFNPGTVVQNTYNYKRIRVDHFTGADWKEYGGPTDFTTTSRDINLRAYMTYPPNFPWGANTRYPVVVLFHGGGWSQGSPAEWTPLALYLASQGVVVAQFQYRLIPKFRPPITSTGVREATKDAVSAIRWLRKNHPALQIDPNKIAAFGDSAGGHLALATSMVDSSISDEAGADAAISSRVQLVLGAYPVTDTSLLYSAELTPKDAWNVTHFQLAIPLQINVQSPEVSPLQLMTASNLPPTVILSSKDDTLDWTSAARIQAFQDRARVLIPSEPNRVKIIWFGTGGNVPVPGVQDHNFMPYDLNHHQAPATPYAAANEAYAQLTLALQEHGFYGGSVHPISTIRSWVAAANPVCTQMYPQQNYFNLVYGYTNGDAATFYKLPYWRRDYGIW